MAILKKQQATGQLLRDFCDRIGEKFSAMKQGRSQQILSQLIAEGSDEMNQTQRYFKIKQAYFGEQQKEFLGEFLGINHARNYDIEVILKYQPKKHGKSLVLQILRSFLNGNVNALGTARQLDQYCTTQKPPFWQLNEFYRFRRMEKFVEFFKLACMREAVLENRELAADKLINRTLLSDKFKTSEPLPAGQFASMFRRESRDNVIHYPRTVDDYLEHLPTE